MNDKQLDEMLTNAFKATHAPEKVVEETTTALRKSGFSATRRRMRASVIAAIAACLVLLAIIPTGIFLYNDVTKIVSIDVNPSVELSVNRFDIVTAARGINADGEDLLAEVPVTGKSCQNAVEMLLKSEKVQAAASDDNAVQVVVSSLDGSSTDAIESQVEAASQATACPCTCSSASSEEYELAQQAGLTVGKYRMYRALQEAGVDISADEVGSMSMRELRDRLDAAGGEDPEHSGDGAGSGFGGGAHGARSGEDNAAHDGSGNGERNGEGGGTQNGNGYHGEHS